MSAAEPDLRRTQQIFWSLITAPEGVRTALEDLGRRGVLAEGDFEAIFAGDGRLPVADRLDIYANMYFYRLLDCLAEDFRRVHAAVGSDRFHNLITDYLLRHPSEHPSLRQLGRKLPAFLQEHALRSEFPYVADLARLDWAHVEVFDAPDSPSLTREGLALLPPEQAGEARFRLVPAFDVLRLEYDIVRIWRDLEESRAEGQARAGAGRNAAEDACAAGTDSRSPGTEASPRVAEPRGPRAAPRRTTRVRVWRQAFVVYHRSVGEEEARCLEMVRDGESLARLCQQLAAGRGPGRATELVGRMLQGFIDDGILAGYALPDRR